MKEFLILSNTDFLLIKRWFSKNSFSKVLVLASFASVFVLVFWVLLKISEFFFTMLSGYPVFGELTASYIVHASVIVLLLFSFSASLFSSLTLLYQGRKQIDFLTTLPLSRKSIIFWINTKSIISSSIIFLLIFSPILIALNSVFYRLPVFSLIILLLLVTFSITIFANALGNTVAFLTVGLAMRYRTLLPSAFLLLFSALAIVTIRTIFPKSLARLYYTETPEQFYAIYNNLPLTKDYIPTKWISDSISGDVTLSFLLLFGLIMIFGYFSILFQSLYLKRVWQNIHEFSGGRKSLKNSVLIRNFFPSSKYATLTTKDLLSVTRLPSEVGYAFFLGAMTVLFFFLVSVGGRFEFSRGGYRDELLLFSFVWFLYFYTAFALRIVFPLMSREGLSRWHILTAPLKGYSIFVAKSVSTIVFSLPFFVISIFVWNAFGLQSTTVPILITFMALLSVSLVTHLIGSLFPLFELSEQPEKTTTSTSGLAALILSVGIISLFGLYLHLYLTEARSALNTLLPLLLITLGLLETVFLLAKIWKRRYLYEREL